MNRFNSSKKISEAQTRYSSRIEGDPCVPGTQESRRAQYDLMQTMVLTPDLLCCGPAIFEKLKIFHSGVCWVAELEALVEEQLNEPE